MLRKEHQCFVRATRVVLRALRKQNQNILRAAYIKKTKDDNDDNDEPGGGLMQPVYNPN